MDSSWAKVETAGAAEQVPACSGAATAFPAAMRILPLGSDRSGALFWKLSCCPVLAGAMLTALQHDGLSLLHYHRPTWGSSKVQWSVLSPALLVPFAMSCTIASFNPLQTTWQYSEKETPVIKPAPGLHAFAVDKCWGKWWYYEGSAKR